MAARKLRVDDIVQFCGTDTLLIVRKCRKEREYLVQRKNDPAKAGWVFGIYLDLVNPPKNLHRPLTSPQEN
jgi:hypothetical protein